MQTSLIDRLADGYYLFDIRSSDIDFSDHLQLSALFSYLQEAAYRHAEQLGIGTGCLDTLGLTWVLSRISLRLDALPKWGQQVQIRTWSRGASKLMFARDFIVSAGPPGGPYAKFASVSTDWLVILKSSHRPQRPQVVLDAAHLPATPGITPRALTEDCPKLQPAKDAVAVLSKQADFSEIDRNRHLNNTRYIAWAMDALYLSMWENLTRIQDHSTSPLDFSAIDLNYLAEILPGESVDLQVSPDLMVEGIDTLTNTCCFRVQFRLNRNKI